MLPLLIGGAAALGAGASIFGGFMGSQGERARANSIARWTNAAGREVRDTEDRLVLRANNYSDKAASTLDPWIQGGKQAMDAFTALLMGGNSTSAMLNNSPLYKFRRQEGERAINRQLASRGLYNSGAGLETLARFGAQLEGEESEKVYSRLAGLINVGATASNNLAGIQGSLGNALLSGTTALGSTIGQIYANAGGPIGAAQAGRYNAIGGAATGVANALTGGIQNYMMLPFFKSFGGGGGDQLKGTPSQGAYQRPGLEEFPGITNPYTAGE